jgi:RNA polymerase sigma-70 factor (ECF subfamily)
MSIAMLSSAVAYLVGRSDSRSAVGPFDRDDPAVRALVVAAQAGDRTAFGTLVTQHEALVFRTALAALGHREDAEEAAQEAFLVAWRKLPGFRGEATFRTWLLTITWRKALDRRRIRGLWWHRTEWGAKHPAGDDYHPTDDLAAVAPSPEHLAVTRDLARQVARQIARLSPKLRDALVLSVSSEQSYVEIAAVLGIPVGTLKWRVAEARRLLASRLGTRPRDADD